MFLEELFLLLMQDAHSKNFPFSIIDADVRRQTFVELVNVADVCVASVVAPMFNWTLPARRYVSDCA